MNSISAITALLMALLLSAAPGDALETQQSVLTTKAQLEGVRRIDHSGPGRLTIRQGRHAGVSITGDGPETAAVLVEVFDDVLYLEVPEGPSSPALEIVVTLPAVDEVISHGPSVVTVEALHADTLSLEALGAGSFQVRSLRAHELLVTGAPGAAFTLSGEVERQVLDLSNPGRYQARSLNSESVEATVVGGGLILLQVDDLLDVRLAGAARLRYVGSPFVSQMVSGAGSVAPVGEISI